MLRPDGITAGGLAFLVTVWTVITGLVGYCFWKILRTRNGGGDS